MLPIGAELAALRTHKQLSIKQLSQSSGIPQAVIEGIEAGDAGSVTLGVLDQLCAALETSIELLFRQSQPNTKDRMVSGLPTIIGESTVFKTILNQAAIAARHDDPVLITGETGTGKNLLAAYIHQLSKRTKEPNIPIICMFPDGLAQAELFGYIRGAFTDARESRAGAFETAAYGTIYLDEIGALPVHLQPLLLQVIEAGMVRRLGEATVRRVSCRILASTNEDITRAIQGNRFRADLYYRFRWRIHIPPLRDRASDIPLLAAFFLEYDCVRLGIRSKTFEPDALSFLMNYSWPGNVRQLESILNLLAISVEKTKICATDLRELFARYGDEPRTTIESTELLKTKRIPYYFGPPVSDPSRFFGRNDELNKILQLLRQSEYGNYWPIAVYGDHRMGKSSLLRILDAKIPSQLKCLSAYIDIAALAQNHFFPAIIKRVAELVYTAAGMGTVQRTIREIKDSKAWQAAVGDISVEILGFIKLKTSPSSEQHWEQFVTILQSLRARLDQYGKYHSIVLILDEVSACANWTGNSELLKNWRSHIQALKGYNFVVADAHPLYQISKDKWSAFFNVFTPILLKGLTTEEAEELIVNPAAELDVQYAPAAISRIRDLSGGKPFYIQVICCCIFERLLKDRNNTHVSIGLVESCVDAVLERLGEHLAASWANLTDFQKEYLLAIVHNEGPELAPRSKAKTFEEQRTQIKLLQDRQLITVDEYKITQIEPILREWISRYYT